MSKGMLGKKLGMTGIYSPEGTYIPVTVLQVGPCVVTQVKTEKNDGYGAIQLGFGEKKEKNIAKPLAEHMKKSGGLVFANLKEFRVENPGDFTLGQKIVADMFNVGDLVDVSGISKGRGFSGTIKRHGFSRGPETHGCRNHRAPGSIGCSAWPGKVVRGKKMPGRYGFTKHTMRNLKIVDIRLDDNLILVRGGIPGANSGVVEINKPKFS